MIKVIIADDHKIVVDGLVSILKEETDIEVVGTTLDGEGVLQLVATNEVDVAILDIEMPGLTGVQLSELLKKKYPEIKILILSMYKTQGFVKKLISIGANGYILKNKGSDELVKAIRSIHAGKSFVGQEITEILIETLRSDDRKKETSKIKLTKREKEVLALIVMGLTSYEIGKKLFISSSTVDTHRKHLIEKAGVRNSKELIRYAMLNNLG